MADEQQQDRTEQATPKRREDARKKGDIARSRELTMTTVMISGAASLLLMAGPIGSRIAAAFADALQFDRGHVFDVSYMPRAFALTASQALGGLFPLALVLIIAVFAGATAIGGWSFSFSSLSFKAERLSPVKGIKRIFSANSLNELIKALAKFTLVAVFAISWLWLSVDELMALGRQPIGSAVANALEICGVSLLVVSTGLILIAAADVPFQLWNHQKKLRMTRQEVRDEFKESEGRPEVKSKIRLLQQQIATRRMMDELPGADIVITNPTHFAVALKYDDRTMGAPRVIAKGQDVLARRIREVASENGIALFSAPPLARVLYKSVQIGDEIPAKLYTAVAQVLAYIFQLNAAVAEGQRHPDLPVLSVDENEF